MITGIEHFAICCEDSAKMKDWYIAAFDLKVVYDNGKGVYFVAFPDGSMLEIMPSDSDNAFDSIKAKGLRHIAISVDEFEAVVDKLKGMNVEIVTEVMAAANGIKTFFFKDIEGNVLHLIYRPAPLV